MEDTANGNAYRPAYPFQELIGFRKVAFESDLARFELEIGPQFSNRAGVPHGGIYAALLDSALGASGCYMGSPNEIRPAVTLNLNISFLATPVGKLLIAEGKRVGGGKRIYFAEGHVKDDTGVMVATASGTFRFVQDRRG